MHYEKICKQFGVETLVDANLRGADLNGANLNGANLNGANLNGANLSYVNLSYVNLSYVNLSGAVLSKANLFRADLRSADLSGAVLSKANLSYANLNKANLSDANLSLADLRLVKLNGADLSGAKLNGSDLSGTDLSGVTGLLNQKDFLSKFEKDKDGWIIAYKTFGSLYNPNPNWLIEPGSIISEECDFNRTIDCGCGINVGALEYVKNNYDGVIYKLAINQYAGICVPYMTDGKFRCAEAKILGVVER